MRIPEIWRNINRRLRFTGIRYSCGHIDFEGRPNCQLCIEERQLTRNIQALEQSQVKLEVTVK